MNRYCNHEQQSLCGQYIHTELAGMIQTEK